MACMRCGHEAAAGVPLCAGCESPARLPAGPGRTHGPLIVLLTAGLVLAAAGAGAGVLLSRPGAGTAVAGRSPANAVPRPGGSAAAGSAARDTAPGARRDAAPGARRPAGRDTAQGARRPAGRDAAGRMRMVRAVTGGTGAGVAVAAGAAAQPGAASVDAFLGRYFAVINEHNYAGYLRLFGPGSGRSLSAAGFRGGYGSTRDSAETLTRISAARAGMVAATVTFTSRQAPAASPAHAACVRWRITIFLVRRGGGYVIGSPPAGYTAADRAC